MKQDGVTIPKVLYNVAIGVFGSVVAFGVYQYKVNSERTISIMEKMDTKLETANEKTQDHLLEFTKTRELVNHIQTDISNIKLTVSNVSSRQQKSEGKLSDICNGLKFYNGWQKYKCE